LLGPYPQALSPIFLDTRESSENLQNPTSHNLLDPQPHALSENFPDSCNSLAMSPSSTSLSHIPQNTTVSVTNGSQSSNSFLSTSRPHSMITRSKHQIRKPTLLPDGSVKYPLPSALTTFADSPDIEPTCYTTAAKYAVWREAMADEFTALLKNGTWSLVSPTPSMNIVGSKWVFRIKRKADGSVERYKARLVAKGFHQQAGIDFGETYSPVVKPITIRTVLTIAVSSGWCIKQIDVSNAFLHGFLSEKVYMSQPVGFVHPQQPNAVCCLKKALYGLKQAPRSWFSRLSNRLFELGFSGSKSDTSLFIFNSAEVRLFALVYVDDIILTGSSISVVDDLIKSLSLTFPIKDLDSLNFFLGVEVHRSSTGLHLSQQCYIADILKRTNMELAKPISSPMSAAAPLSKLDGISMTDPTIYRSTVGALQYLSITRPDIAFAVNKVSQFASDPCDVHWSAIKRILRYLKHTIMYGLLIKPRLSSQLVVFSDADW
jgi:hypothetical protein